MNDIDMFDIKVTGNAQLGAVWLMLEECANMQRYHRATAMLHRYPRGEVCRLGR
jgi:hypothetical protein